MNHVEKFEQTKKAEFTAPNQPCSDFKTLFRLNE